MKLQSTNNLHIKCCYIALFQQYNDVINMQFITCNVNKNVTPLLLITMLKQVYNTIKSLLQLIL